MPTPLAGIDQLCMTFICDDILNLLRTHDTIHYIRNLSSFSQNRNDIASIEFIAMKWGSSGTRLGATDAKLGELPEHEEEALKELKSTEKYRTLLADYHSIRREAYAVTADPVERGDFLWLFRRK